MFRILIILLLLSGCGNKQILPSPLSELNSIRNLFNFLDFVDDEEEEAETEWTEEEAVSSGINTSGLIEAETLEIDENGEVHLMGPKQEDEIYFYKRDVWIAKDKNDKR